MDSSTATMLVQGADAPRSPERARASSLVRWSLLVLAAGYLLFAHGCHLGDHDDELFIRFMSLLGACFGL